MSNRTRKALIRARIAKRLEYAFNDIYYNAMLGWYTLPADANKFFDSNAQWEELQEHFSWELDEINDTRGKDRNYIEQHIARDYGKVYCYGRGGRTCAPSQWIRTGGGSSFSIAMPETDDMNRWAMLTLALDVEAWNAYVKAECSSESISEIMRACYVARKTLYEEERREYAARLTI